MPGNDADLVVVIFQIRHAKNLGIGISCIIDIVETR